MASTPDKMNKKMTFTNFKHMALDASLSQSEKIGFPDSYRENYEPLIFVDIKAKLALDKSKINVLDVGCGCSELTKLVIQNSLDRKQQIYLLDSEEMLNNVICEQKSIHKIYGKFPMECEDFIDAHQQKFNAILVYSVMQHVILDSNIFDFIDQLVGLLCVGGKLLLGDLPNISKRNRFFSSDSGIKFHQQFTQTDSEPDIRLLQLERDKIDDGMIFGILQRYRGFGFESYLIPQGVELPLSNRREDILIVRN